jgi:phage shock protein A
MENIETQILARLKPYQDRIAQLESSLEQKDNEVAIYKLAVERLQAKVKQLSAAGSKKGATSGGRGTASSTRKPARSTRR